MNIKEEIKNIVSMVDVASLYLDLKPAGKNFKALCPFHREKTPSFFVNPLKNSFTCYGCNEYGDIFSLVEKMENINFSASIDFLISKFSLNISRQKTTDYKQKVGYRDINNSALNFFKENLLKSSADKKALSYLHGRGIISATIEKFSLGYAENKWDGLYRFLQHKSVSISRALELGLLIKNNDKIYDRFRGRIIFPIFTETGEVVAFGGRTIFNDKIKYLNSPDNPVYKKGKTLYGFNLSKPFIREKRSAIIVEGYFDQIALFNNGISNVVASLGTALTDDQIYLLKRFASSIYIFFDSDEAGISAALKGIEKIIMQNITPKVIELVDHKDPDEFITRRSLKDFKELLNNSMDGFSFLIEKISAKYDLNIPGEKRRAINELCSILENIEDPILKDQYLLLIADFFLVNPGSLYQSRNTGKNAESNLQDKLQLPLSEKIFFESIVKLSLIKPGIIAEIKELFNEELYSALLSGNMLKILFACYDENWKNLKIKIFYWGK